MIMKGEQPPHPALSEGEGSKTAFIDIRECCCKGKTLKVILLRI